MSEHAAPGSSRSHGWGIRLRFAGRTLLDRRVRGDATLRVGEDPTCNVVVPGLGGAVVVAVGAQLRRAPGLGGTVHRGGEARPLGESALDLAPGDRAELTVDAHPEITLELRRELFERLPLGAVVNLRELAQQLTLGAGLVAGLILLVRHQAPVNTLELKGEPDAPEDSALVRAMFVAAAEVPPPDPRLFERWVAPPPAVAVAAVEGEGPVAEAAAPEDPPAPIATLAEPVPTDVLGAAPATSQRRRGRAVESAILGELNAIGTLSLVGDDLDEQAPAVLGGVLGGVLDARDEDDLPPTAPTVEAGELPGVGHVVLDRAGPDTTVKEIEPGVEFAEAIMGPGVVDVVAVPEDRSAVDIVAVPEDRSATAVIALAESLEPPPTPVVPPTSPPGASPRPPTVPTPLPQPSPVPSIAPGVHDYPADSHVVVRGTAEGLAAVAPDVRCEDPALIRKTQLDVVFVVDVSTTMRFMLDRIDQQIAKVDDEARAQGLDPRYGLVVFVDDVELGNAGQAYADLPALQRDLARWRAFTASNREIASEVANLDWPENTLDAVHAAATGFAWRPAATTLRMVVHATDDDFGEAPAIQSGQTIRHTYAETVAALRDAEVRMFSFAAKVGGQCECLDVRPGLFTRFRGRPSLPSATGGAVFDIDEVASGKLSFVAAVAGAIKSGVCTRYPLSPFAGAPR